MYNNPPRSHEYHTMEGQDDIEIGGESDDERLMHYIGQN